MYVGTSILSVPLFGPIRAAEDSGSPGSEVTYEWLSNLFLCIRDFCCQSRLIPCCGYAPVGQLETNWLPASSSLWLRSGCLVVPRQSGAASMPVRVGLWGSVSADARKRGTLLVRARSRSRSVCPCGVAMNTLVDMIKLAGGSSSFCIHSLL